MSDQRTSKMTQSARSALMRDFIEQLINGTATSPSIIVGEASRAAIVRYRDVLARRKKKTVA